MWCAHQGTFSEVSLAKVIGHQPELVEGGFKIGDDFLGDDVGYDLREMAPDPLFLQDHRDLFAAKGTGERVFHDTSTLPHITVA
jgi:hypothetical protein